MNTITISVTEYPSQVEAISFLRIILDNPVVYVTGNEQAYPFHEMARALRSYRLLCNISKQDPGLGFSERDFSNIEKKYPELANLLDKIEKDIIRSREYLKLS